MCVLFLGEAHLRRVLQTYAGYYNKIRTHRSLHKDAPISRPFSRPEASNQTLFLVDFITIMSGFRFSVHTGWFDFRVAHLGQRSPRGKAAACACRVMVISESLRDCRAYIHISLPVAGGHSPSAVRHASVPTNSSLTADDRHCCVCAANAHG